MALGHDHVLGLCPTGSDAEHARAHRERARLPAHALDLARELKARNVGRRARRRRIAPALL
jgi:hypothetical protein